MQFPEGATQPKTDTKSINQPVKEVEQTFMHKMTRLYEIVEADLVDSSRHVAEDGW